jgi:acyl-CoA thioesterase FadM
VLRQVRPDADAAAVPEDVVAIIESVSVILDRASRRAQRLPEAMRDWIDEQL